MDVLDLGDSSKATRDEYLAVSEICRREMEHRYLGFDFDLEAEVEANKDTGLTYQKYIRSATEDLIWGPDIDSTIKNENKLYVAETKKVAKRMTERLIGRA